MKLHDFEHPWERTPHPAAIPDAWDMAERFRPYVRDAHEPIERPTPVDQRCQSLRAEIYPACPLCALDANACECDPDEKGNALWAMFQARRAQA
jgi:hypothetical protein